MLCKKRHTINMFESFNTHENSFLPNSLCCYSFCRMMMQTYRSSEPNHIIINNRKDKPNGEQVILNEQHVSVCGFSFTGFFLALVSMANVSVISAFLLGYSWWRSEEGNSISFSPGRLHSSLTSLRPCFGPDPNTWICRGSPLQTERGAKISTARRGSEC